MRPQSLDAIRQVKPPVRCTDEELINRLMQGEFFKVFKGELIPSPAEVMKAGPRSKQEARSIIKKYEESTKFGGGVESRHAMRGPSQPNVGSALRDGVGVAPNPPKPYSGGSVESTHAPDRRSPDKAERTRPALRSAEASGDHGNELAASLGKNEAGVAPSPPETKISWTEIAVRVIGLIPEKSIALTVGGLGGWLAYIQLGINYEFWRSQGQTLGAKDQFGYVGIIIEVLLNLLLPARRILKDKGEKWWSFVLLLGVLFCWGASTYASWNFAARNIDDGTLRRQVAKDEIAKLQRERDDWVRVQLVHSRDGRLNAARADGDQIQYRDNQIRELQPKVGATVLDVFNTIGKFFYASIPTLSGTLIMASFLGLMGRKNEQA